MKRFGTGGLLCCSALDSIARPGGTKNPPCLSWGSVRARYNQAGVYQNELAKVIGEKQASILAYDLYVEVFENPSEKLTHET